MIHNVLAKSLCLYKEVVAFIQGRLCCIVLHLFIRIATPSMFLIGNWTVFSFYFRVQYTQ